MPHDPHEEYRELCTLSITGELTAEEWARLREHLSRCPACRETQRQYNHVAATTLPALAAETARDSDQANAPGNWSIEDAEAALMESLRDEPRPARTEADVPSRSQRTKKIVMFAAAAAALATFGLSGYWIGSRQERGRQVAYPAPSRANREAAANKTAPPSDESTKTSADSQVAILESQVRQGQEESAKLNDQLSRVEDELAKRSAELDQSRKERAELASELEAAQTDTQTLQTKLDAAGDQDSADSAHLLSLRSRVDDLNASLEEKDNQIATEQDLLDRDRDIRNLIGARNLYIAEIYDVAKSGDTQKPFGRIFYTKDQSLVFYAYDLDQQQGLKKESAFEVWGRLETGGARDVSLGLLYQDDAAKKRWVLKVNDAKTVSGLDAVFVTVEPKGGSAKPSGKPLLFTYLRLDSNHP